MLQINNHKNHKMTNALIKIKSISYHKFKQKIKINKNSIIFHNGNPQQITVRPIC